MTPVNTQRAIIEAFVKAHSTFDKDKEPLSEEDMKDLTENIAPIMSKAFEDLGYQIVSETGESHERNTCSSV